MTPNDLTHKEKDDLITLTKKALELVCARLACYEGKHSPESSPEHWIKIAYLSTKTTSFTKIDYLKQK